MSTSTVTTSSAVRARQGGVEDAVHSLEMEGFSVDEDTRADLADYAAGTADVDGLIRRARTRFGLD